MKVKTSLLFILTLTFAFSLPSNANDYSLGIGIGRTFGMGGFNGTYAVNDDLNLALGLGGGKFIYSDKLNFSLGINYFLGEQGDTFRKRIGLNYNEYQESGIQVTYYDSRVGEVVSTSSESRFKGFELDLGITRFFGSERNQSWEFGTTIPLIKEETEDDELWGDDTYTSDGDGISIHLEFYLGYRRHF